MKFTGEERELILKFFDERVSRENVQDHLSSEMYNFIRDQSRLGTVCDRLTFVNRNKFRPYESLILTKFLTENVSIPDFIEKITGLVKGRYLVFVDAHFLILCPSPDDSKEIVLKFQRASKASSVNDTIKIRNGQEHARFISEFKDMQINDFLNHCFEHHSELFAYQGSGLRPYALISLVMHIQKY